MRILRPNLAAYYLAIWTENAVKFVLSNEKGREKSNKSEVGVERQTQ